MFSRQNFPVFRKMSDHIQNLLFLLFRNEWRTASRNLFQAFTKSRGIKVTPFSHLKRSESFPDDEICVMVSIGSLPNTSPFDTWNAPPGGLPAFSDYFP